MAEIPLLQIVQTLTDLKAVVPSTNMNALLIGKNTLGDSLGGFYRWDSTDTTSVEDTQFMNVIPSTVSGASGRWVRIFQKAKSYPQGIMVTNGGVKTLFVSGTTDSNGEISINLTADNTTTGTALFAEVWSIVPQPAVDATGPSTAVSSYRKSVAANLKTATYGFFKANPVTITVGLLYNPVTSVGSGTPVNFRIEGI